MFSNGVQEMLTFASIFLFEQGVAGISSKPKFMYPRWRETLMKLGEIIIDKDLLDTKKKGFVVIIDMFRLRFILFHFRYLYKNDK